MRRAVASASGTTTDSDVFVNCKKREGGLSPPFLFSLLSGFRHINKGRFTKDRFTYGELMKLHSLTRKVHYWGALLIALPVLVILTSGLLLQMKKQLPWVQPPEKRGASKEMSLTFPQILAACQSVPEAEVKTWDDINRLDVRPSRGMIKVWASNNWEVQLDSSTGKVLQVAYRRSDMIEAIHDGSYFHEAAKLWLFLPAAFVLLLLWLTGMYLFFLPIYVRRRQKANLTKRVNLLTPTQTVKGSD